MRNITIIILNVFISSSVFSQGEYKGKFEQLGTTLPTPNSYRTASGEPGPDYWQQQADYDMDIVLDDENQILSGSEKITYYNNAPSTLKYLWVQLDQNMRKNDSDRYKSSTNQIRDSINAKSLIGITRRNDYEGGYKITAVKDHNGNDLEHTINKTMMRVELPQPLNTGGQFTFQIDWSYKINDRMLVGGRGGYEYFPKDGNYLYTIAQFYPRMAVYNDNEGWQNKQFLGRGEFTLPFGDFRVRITVPADHVVAASGVLQNPKDVLTKTQLNKFEKAKGTFDEPVIVVTEEEAVEKEKNPNYNKKATWIYHADNVRDFAFASSRKFIWDAMAVKINDKTPLAMSYYPKEGNPLWEEESTVAVARTLLTYSKHTIDYPYPVAISVHAASIGMEYPMICFNFGRPNEDGSYSEAKKWGMIGVIIHEVGHNFFPMIINSDERQWTWMDEGLNTFVQTLTEKEWYPEKPLRRGPPRTIVNYMKGSKEFIRPIMTNSEQILQFGNNAYAKPAAALTLLRETIMGPELFDYAFKEYAERWAFKHPTPADFFRTMEDASAVDLDWFWRGWFYTTDHVDVSIENVNWYRIKSAEEGFEKRVQGKITGGQSSGDDEGENKDFSEGFKEFTVINTEDRYYREFMNTVNDNEIRKEHADLNFYEVTLKNVGGLVSPVILEWTFKDGTKEKEQLPAEIWRYNENIVTKVFAKEKEVVNVKFDPDNELADTDTENNNFPRVEEKSRFDKFKEGDR